MNRIKKILAITVLTLLCFTMLSGCVLWQVVETWEVGLMMEDGVSISEVLPAGRYTNNAIRSQLITVDMQAIQTSWSDPNLLTSDKQQIAFDISVTFQRDRNNIENMWENYNSAARSDEALTELVLARIPRVAKAVTSDTTLDAMLGRETLQNDLFEQLSLELGQIGVILLDVGVNNIQPEEEYLDALTRKATATINAEVAKQETLTLQENLVKEKAQTEINLEEARRQNLVQQERAKIYETSPEMMQIELARIQADALKAANVVYLPSESAISIINGGYNPLTSN